MTLCVCDHFCCAVVMDVIQSFLLLVHNGNPMLEGSLKVMACQSWETVTLLDGRVMTRKQLYEMLSPRSNTATSLLIQSMKKDEKCVIEGIWHTKLRLLLWHLDRDMFDYFWCCELVKLVDEYPVVVQQKLFASKKELVLYGLCSLQSTRMYDQSTPELEFHLATCMSINEEIEIDRHKITPRYLLQSIINNEDASFDMIDQCKLLLSRHLLPGETIGRDKAGFYRIIARAEAPACLRVIKSLRPPKTTTCVIS